MAGELSGDRRLGNDPPGWLPDVWCDVHGRVVSTFETMKPSSQTASRRSHPFLEGRIASQSLQTACDLPRPFRSHDPHPRSAAAGWHSSIALLPGPFQLLASRGRRCATRSQAGAVRGRQPPELPDRGGCHDAPTKQKPVAVHCHETVRQPMMATCVHLLPLPRSGMPASC